MELTRSLSEVEGASLLMVIDLGDAETVGLVRRDVAVGRVRAAAEVIAALFGLGRGREAVGVRSFGRIRRKVSGLTSSGVGDHVGRMSKGWREDKGRKGDWRRKWWIRAKVEGGKGNQNSNRPNFIGPAFS
jgi:hypothetical protein